MRITGADRPARRPRGRRAPALAGSALAAMLAAALAGPPAARAQRAPAPVAGEVFAGGELESYLRMLQLTGEAAPHQWSLRSFSPSEVQALLAADSAHPWARRFALTGGAGDEGRTWFRLLAPQADAIANSAFPYGVNDGPLWAGRGLTAALQAGFAGRAGPLSFTVYPMAFVAQNAAFDLTPNGLSGDGRFQDWRFPRYIDLPQRFGDGAFACVDPGQSTVRLDLRGFAAGFSTANQAWGPADQLPLILGTNAPGFAHAFVGTSHPVGVGIGRVHAQILWGALEQSGYGPMPADSDRRFASGLVAVYQPKWVPGLELGGSRFFHSPWKGLSGESYLKPLEGLLKSRLSGSRSRDNRGDADNQIASVFARWAFPRSGLEAYGEFAREDHSYDLRDLALEPDHESGFMLGLQKVWSQGARGATRLRAEVLDSRITWLADVRPQGVMYYHTNLREGHTNQGQILGSPAAYGGAGALVALDRYHPGGRWTLRWTRTQIADVLADSTGVRGPDVQHALGAEALFFRGRADVTAGVNAVFELNRGYRDDAFDLNATLRLRVLL